MTTRRSARGSAAASPTPAPCRPSSIQCRKLGRSDEKTAVRRALRDFGLGHRPGHDRLSRAAAGRPGIHLRGLAEPDRRTRVVEGLPLLADSPGVTAGEQCGEIARSAGRDRVVDLPLYLVV